MQRIAMVLKIKKGKKMLYKKIHEEVWPEIIVALSEANIQNNSTFVSNDLLFMYLEHTGENFWEDWKKYGQKPKVQEWFLQMKECLEPYESPTPTTIWTVLEEAFHMD